MCRVSSCHGHVAALVRADHCNAGNGKCSLKARRLRPRVVVRTPETHNRRIKCLVQRRHSPCGFIRLQPIKTPFHPSTITPPAALPGRRNRYRPGVARPVRPRCRDWRDCRQRRPGSRVPTKRSRHDGRHRRAFAPCPPLTRQRAGPPMRVARWRTAHGISIGRFKDRIC